jgi:hypothetical protein
MAIIPNREPNLTPKERAELEWEKESTHLQVDYAQRMKELELEVKKLEVKWTQVFRLPQMVLLLPVKILASLAIPISVITKKDLPDAYWEFMKYV